MIADVFTLEFSWFIFGAFLGVCSVAFAQIKKSWTHDFVGGDWVERKGESG